jgi:hypothetical protein
MKVSLFPFLPVLLCMMGAMVLLLVLVAWDVRELADNPAAAAVQTMTIEEAEELRQKLKMKTEDADWHTENFTLTRKQAEEELAELQTKLALAERETQKIKDELARLEQLTKQLDSQASTTPEEIEQLKRLLAQQQQRKAEAELELAELQKEAAQKEKSYSIVPHRGPNGTFRRPIYIECRNDKIIIQPEGVELVPNDFQALDRPDNPFDTVLRVIRQYYIDTNQIVRGSEPYPLLIVRPSGVEMYENARMAAGNWVKDFGYEIVNEDWNIQYPEPNEELRHRLLQQLDTARSRLNGYMAAMRRAEPSPGYGGNAAQFRVDHHGNIIPTGAQTQSSEYLQGQLAARREGGDGRQQTADGSRGEDGRRQTADGSREEGGRRQTADGNRSGEGTQQGEQMSSLPPQNVPQRPQNWALQGATQFSSGISRAVKIRCEANRFVLSAQVGTKERTIPIAGSVSSSADQLVQAIWEFQESWGSAGENMHWKPRLQVQVSPGGEQRLQELKIHLRNSGLAIEE